MALLEDEEITLLSAILAIQNIDEANLVATCKKTQENYLKIKETFKEIKNNESPGFFFGSINPKRKR